MGKGELNDRDVSPQGYSSAPGVLSPGNAELLDCTGDKRHHQRLLDRLPFLEERIVVKMPSELRHLDGVLDYLSDRMLSLGIVTVDDAEVLIALDEAIVNAVKHGNKCDPRKAVHIVAEFNAEGARFTISDEGSGFAREKVPDPTEPCRLLEPSGRGLLLINHIMDEVCFNKSGNRLEMFKRCIGGPNAQPISSGSETKPD